MAEGYNVDFDQQRTIRDEDLKTTQVAATDTGSLNKSILEVTMVIQSNKIDQFCAKYKVKCTLKFWTIQNSYSL